jgi:hypothetical protein
LDKAKLQGIWEFRFSGGANMLIRLSSKNQITAPRKILANLPKTKYFELELEDGALVLKPVEMVETKLDQIQRKMTDLRHSAFVPTIR